MQIKVNHLLNLSKTLLQLGYRIRKQALVMQFMNIPILLPLKCLNLIKEAAIRSNLKGEYNILSIQAATAWKVLRANDMMFLLLLLLD